MVHIMANTQKQRAAMKLDPIMEAVAQVIADRTERPIEEVRQTIHLNDQDVLFAFYIGPAIDKMQKDFDDLK
jgi:hypothetical protein